MMQLFFVFGIVLPVVCEAITQIIGFSELFKPLREFVEKRKTPFLNELLKCKYCLSVWVALGVTVPVWFTLVACTLANFFFLGLAVMWVHRVSNIAHLVYDILYQHKMWRWVYTLPMDGGKE